MKNKGIAVIFPGIGYHTDKPLLYYAKKLAKESGYDPVEVSYEFPFKASEIKGNRDKMEEAFRLAVKQVETQLSSVKTDEYDRIIFIGKSIGTAVAAYYDKTHDINAGHVVFTPVPDTFAFLKKGSGIVFNGNSDPWCDTGLAEKKCRELEMDIFVVDRANHSLETGSVVTDVRNLADIMEKVTQYISSIN